LFSTGSTQAVVDVETTYTLTATNEFGSTTAEASVTMREPRPNILVVIVDDMGSEDTSVNFNYDIDGNVLEPIDPTSVGLPEWSDDPGNEHYRTPSMETLAASGMKFSRAYAQQVCSPTRCSLMTGMNSARHHTIQWLGKKTDVLYNVKMPTSPGLVPSNYTLAEIMRDYGYRTIIAGKGHIGDDYVSTAGIYETPSTDPDNDFYGFQVNISASDGGSHGDCYSDDSTAFGLPASGSTAGLVAEYQDMTYGEYDPVTYTNGHPLADEPLFITEAITHELIERIEDSVDANLPFFAYYSQFALHAPHDTDPRFIENYPKFADEDGNYPETEDEDANTYNALAFATMVEGMDKGLGDVLAALEDLGEAENTLVIFLGDNGSDARPRGPTDNPTLTMTNPLRGEKGMRYEGGIRVPLIISWAKRNDTNAFQQTLLIPADSREDDLVVVQDLFPTILAAANISVPEVDDAGDPLIVDGYDLGPYLREEEGTHRPQTLITHAPCASRSRYFTTYHEGTWKLLYSYVTSSPVDDSSVPLGTYELYDLATDPYEAVNLATNYPDRVMSMARDMVAELESLDAEYPILREDDEDLAALGLSASAGDDHPVILPELSDVDIDDDGLADNVEDPNRNGLQDDGETDPDNEDSDGDSTSDGSEVALGLDPLDSGSYFYLQGTTDIDGELTLTWPSLPDTSFEIRFSTNLVDWTTILETDYPAASSNSTSYPASMTDSPNGFYRIELN
jgi:arylsulfatase A-like enzyme